VRHGESEWNDLNIFTGWADAALNEKGVKEAKQGGQYLKEAGFTFDVAYTSVLKRAIKTLWLVLEEMDLMYIPIVSLVMCCGEILVYCNVLSFLILIHSSMLPSDRLTLGVLTNVTMEVFRVSISKRQWTNMAKIKY